MMPSEEFHPFAKIRDALSSLPGSNLDGEIRGGNFVVRVDNKNEWNTSESMGKLSEIFGALIMNEYDPERVRSPEEQMRFSFQDCDMVYVEACRGGIGAFCALERSTEDPSVAIIRDVISDPEARGLYFFKIFREICSDPSITTLVGTSDNPALIETVTHFGKRGGQEVSFADQGKEMPHIQKLLAINKRYLEKEGLLLEEIEPGIYVLPAKVLVPLSQEVIDKRIGRESANFGAFQRIVDLQANYSNGETVAGGLVMILRENDDYEDREEQKATGAVSA